MATLLTRSDIIEGLRALIAELHADRQIACIRLVGGAALALRYFDRRTTQDLDALYVQPGDDAAVAGAAARVARERGWGLDWLNFAVEQTGSLPQWGRTVEWETMYDHEGIVIQVASKETLLAMKLRANRPGRDTDDIRQLLALCEIADLDGAEGLYEEFYPGESLTDRAIRIVTSIFDQGLPVAAPPPGPLEL